MSENKCPKLENCPIFIGSAFKIEGANAIYKSEYCLAGKAKYETYKRYIASEALKKPIPVKIMSNSSISVADIEKLINK